MLATLTHNIEILSRPQITRTSLHPIGIDALVDGDDDDDDNTHARTQPFYGPLRSCLGLPG